MRVGIDATCWQNNRGYGRHARALLSTLVRQDSANHYTVFLDSAENTAGLPPQSEVKLLSTNRPTALAAAADGRRSLRDMWRVSSTLSAADLDILLFPTIYSYVPTFGRAKKLVMIHDVIAETYPDLTLPRRAARLFWNAKVMLGRLQADALITVSNYSRDRMAEHFRISPDRIFVVGEAGDPVFRRLPDPQPTPRLLELGLTPERRMIIYVGGFSPHKNLKSLLSAFARLCAQPGFSDVVLVMVGEYKKEIFHSYFGTLSALADSLHLREHVIFTGYLPDEELVVLLNLATALVLPSLMEGFGLPAVEAAACGCPVIATQASPLPELLGEGGIYIDPRAPGLEKVLAQVAGSEPLRMRMREAGLAAAHRLSWDNAARQLMAVMHKVMEQ